MRRIVVHPVNRDDWVVRTPEPVAGVNGWPQLRWTIYTTGGGVLVPSSTRWLPDGAAEVNLTPSGPPPPDCTIVIDYAPRDTPD